MNLQGKVAVVTGASSGIGRATALELARRGASLVLSARREEPLEEAARECGANAVAVLTDVTDEAAVQRLARAAVERFGGVDVWVNNAGVYAVGRFEDTPSEAFERVHQTNFLGSVYGARTALPHLRARGPARWPPSTHTCRHHS